MIAASTYLPRISSRPIAASSIQGTGAQNFANAILSGCSAVSGIEFGPEFFSRVCASLAVRPPAGLGSATAANVAGAALNAKDRGNKSFLQSVDAPSHELWTAGT